MCAKAASPIATCCRWDGSERVFYMSVAQTSPLMNKRPFEGVGFRTCLESDTGKIFLSKQVFSE